MLCLTLLMLFGQNFIANFDSLNAPFMPYRDLSELEPYINRTTLWYHFFKHHQSAQDNLNNLLRKTAGYQNLSLPEIVQMSYRQGQQDIFNAAAQVWNHNFYWFSMKRNGGGRPSGNLLAKIRQDFSSFENFKQWFIEAGKAQFASGWVWLVYNK